LNVLFQYENVFVLFVTTVISQGSAASDMKCACQYNNRIVANFLMNLTLNELQKYVNICPKLCAKSIEVPVLIHSVCCCRVQCETCLDTVWCVRACVCVYCYQAFI